MNRSNKWIITHLSLYTRGIVYFGGIAYRLKLKLFSALLKVSDVYLCTIGLPMLEFSLLKLCNSSVTIWPSWLFFNVFSSTGNITLIMLIPFLNRQFTVLTGAELYEILNEHFNHLIFQAKPIFVHPQIIRSIFSLTNSLVEQDASNARLQYVFA